MEKKRARIYLLIWVVALFLLLIFLANLMPKYVGALNFLVANKNMLIGLLTSIGGLVTGVVVNILLAYVPKIVDAGLENLANALMDLAKLTRSSLEKLAKSLQNQINNQTTKLFGIITAFTASTTLFIRKILFFIIETSSQKIKGFVAYSKAPRWYRQKGAIDPGLIEVSLAVTAVIIAGPSLLSSDTPTLTITVIRFVAEAMSIFTSISLLDLYSKDKGANSNILLSPIESGPFFILGWSIIIGLIVLGLLTFLPY